MVTYRACCPPCHSHGGRQHQSQTSIWELHSQWDLKFAGRHNIFNGPVQEHLYCLSKMSCLLSKNIQFYCWGWRHHKYKYNYNWSLATGLNEVNYVQTRVLSCASRRNSYLYIIWHFYKISLKDFPMFTHFTKIHNLTEITPLSSNMGERKT